MQEWLQTSLSAALLCAAVATPGVAQEEDEESPYRPGLIADYSTGESTAAIRIDESIAFDWQDASPDPRLAAGEFRAQWRGRLWTQSPGTHRLAVFVQGHVSLKLGGKEIIAGTATEPKWIVSDELDLPFDYHPFELAYRRTGPRGRLAIYWTGPGFVLEPIPERFLFHDRVESPSQAFEQGRQLASALGCAACHLDDSAAAMPAPALDHLSGNVSREWLVEWLSGVGNRESDDARMDRAISRRMPHFAMTAEEASAIADWLLRLPAEAAGQIEQKDAKDAKKGGKEKSGKEKKSEPSAEAGEQLFLTLGCLACHQHGSLGESGLFGGGDLTKIAAKRPAEFFARWLADPATLNKHHRMPVFELSADERTSLSLWLAKQDTPAPLSPGGRGVGGEGADLTQGTKLITRHRCAACHTLPGTKDGPLATPPKPLTAASDWTRACSADPDAKTNRPGYQLAAEDQAALQAYFSSLGSPQRAFPTAQQAAGRYLLVQLNCLACHQREGIDRQVNLLPARLQDKLLAVAEAHSELAKQIPAMTPPALNSVGDKLHDQALADAIRRKGPPHRPYLQVRMPKFNLTDQQLTALTTYFTTMDRIPQIPKDIAASIRNLQSTIRNPEPRPMVAALQAGPRLVTTDGFGCTSCHQVGGVLPDKAPLNARGPDISLLEKRIRREWFDRWCYSPARIVPRMEMPSVQVPVRGVLGDNVTDQLAAVWHTLNTPGFQPPEPNPIRVLRLSGVPERKESPIILHDVVKDGDKTYLFPLVIGLPNRHNILFDLETNRLAAWWLGDTARQRTKGKSWWWEMANKPLYGVGEGSDIALESNGKVIPLRARGQFQSQLDFVMTRAKPSGNLGPYSGRFPSCTMHYQLSFDNSDEGIDVVQRFGALELEGGRDVTSGFIRYISLNVPRRITKVRIRLIEKQLAQRTKWNSKEQILTIGEQPQVRIRVGERTDAEWTGDGTIAFEIKPAPEQAGNKDRLSPSLQFRMEYLVNVVSDQYLVESPVQPPLELKRLEIAPGFAATRLSLPGDAMPTALSWNREGTLQFTTLKGQILQASDTDADECEDQIRLIVDGLATPYGLLAYPPLVLTKGGLVSQARRDDGVSIKRVIAFGWGVTDDYHDWAVGVVAGRDRAFFIGLPCQQDNRSEAAAKYRGHILRVAPKAEDTQLCDIQTVSSGHRFPMGLAMNRAGDLFVTDNQGNYNPFNELNHVRPGKHFGFINANEKEAGFKPPPLEEPAINIPHPWTRSVNGICFLDTPQAMRDAGKDNVFGPLEGHLIGCEYDTRRLIRMTLQKIGDTYQGAAYPLSIPPDDVEKGLLGPIVCAVKPTTGELYIGEIRDSGWGAGNNVGQIVKIKIEPEKLPCGIAEMKATADGFTLDFFQPVDAKKAADAANYSLQSYRRESTPAYGGPDLDRRTEKIAAIEVSPDRKRVTLKLPELRERFVYELRLKNLAPKNAMFHPDEAHFTLRQTPR